MNKEDYALDTFWVNGVNSFSYPSHLKQGEYQWGINVDNSGGVIQTRQGFRAIPGMDHLEQQEKPARGMTVFHAVDREPVIIIARGNQLLYSPFPFTDQFDILPGASWRDTLGQVTFTAAVVSTEKDDDGNTRLLNESYSVLIIQDGQGRAMVWDGDSLMESDPSDNGIPIGLWGQWIGNRYWVASGNKVWASDLGNPLKFIEANDSVTGGGYLPFPDNITGMGQTPDQSTLLVFTDQTTSVVQAGIYERSDWGVTNDFQKVLFQQIGCAAGKSITHQYGMTWWFSHDGLIGLDQALQTYRSSKLNLRDMQMARSKGNMSPDIRGICAGSFGNNLMVSVPSGDGLNAHTWVLNEFITPKDSPSAGEWMGVWTGVRPVEWVNAVINGEKRCFFFSQDYKYTDAGPGYLPPDYYTNVWEAFIGDRVDISTRAKKIECSFETRGLGYSEEFKSFEWAELDLAEIVGPVDLEVYYAGMRGGYKKILEKRIAASQGSANGPDNVTASTEVSTGGVTLPPIIDGVTITWPIPVVSTAGFENTGTIHLGGYSFPYVSKTATTFTVSVALNPTPITFPAGTQVTQRMFSYGGDNDTIVTSYRPQTRTVRTQTVNAPTDCSSCEVESNRTENIDRAFTILVKWTGKMAITGIRICTQARKDYQQGTCEADENTSRYVTEEGCGDVVETVTQPESYTYSTLRSRYMQVLTPKRSEFHYSSFIPTIFLPI